MEHLPHYVLLWIFQWLPVADRTKAVRVCRRWAVVADWPDLWADMSSAKRIKAMSTLRPLEAFKKSAARYRLRREDVVAHRLQLLETCCQNGDLGVVAWLVEHYDVDRLLRAYPAAAHHLLYWAGRAPSPDVLRWLVRNYGLDAIRLISGCGEYSSPAIESALYYGRVESVKYIFQVVTDAGVALPNRAHVLSTACESGNVDLVLWAADRYAPATPAEWWSALPHAVHSGRAEMAWLVTQRIGEVRNLVELPHGVEDCRGHVLTTAVHKAQLPTLANLVEWVGHDYMRRDGQVEELWNVARYCGRIDVLRWIRAKFNVTKEIAHGTEAMIESRYCGGLEILQYLEAEFGAMPRPLAAKMRLHAARVGDAAMVEWLAGRADPISLLMVRSTDYMNLRELELTAAVCNVSVGDLAPPRWFRGLGDLDDVALRSHILRIAALPEAVENMRVVLMRLGQRNDAATFQRLEQMFPHMRHVVLSAETAVVACREGRFRFVRYAAKRPAGNFPVAGGIAAALEWDRLEIARWLAEHFDVPPADVLRATKEIPLSRLAWDALEWLETLKAAT
jgi:hypothetical protein